MYRVLAFCDSIIIILQFLSLFEVFVKLLVHVPCKMTNFGPDSRWFLLLSPKKCRHFTWKWDQKGYQKSDEDQN